MGRNSQSCAGWIMRFMGNRSLTGRELDHLREAHLTYVEVGQTQGELPNGYRHLCRQVTIGTGLARFEEASQILFGWGVHRRSGLHVRSPSEWVTEGDVAVLRLGLGVAAIKAPVKIVYVVNESHRKGFAYGALPGHPESGEEAFLLELHADGVVTLTITAFSRPSSLLVRVAGPVSRAVQRWITRRYLRALSLNAVR